MAAAAATGTSLIAPAAQAADPVSTEAPVTLASLPTDTTAQDQDTLISQSLIVDEAIVYEQGTGFYATVGIGGTWANDINGRVNKKDGTRRGIELETKGGFSLDAGVGYDFGPLRTELTYVYNRIGVDDINRNKNWDSVRTRGGNQNGIMASAYWDINTGSRWTPYIGGGIGWINQSMGNNKLVRTDNGGNVVRRINTGSGSDDLFGWQAKAGVAYGVNWNTDIYAEAVYQGAESFRAGRTSYDALDNNWGFKIGARYRFGGPVVEVEEEVVITPAPAPAPAPRPQPAPVFQPEPAPIRGLW
jgi:opacity protein-like surface antigen